MAQLSLLRVKPKKGDGDKEALSVPLEVLWRGAPPRHLTAILMIAAAKWHSKEPTRRPLLVVGNFGLRGLCNIPSVPWVGCEGVLPNNGKGCDCSLKCGKCGSENGATCTCQGRGKFQRVVESC